MGVPLRGHPFHNLDGADLGQAEIAQPDITVIRKERAYENYGWMILSASAILGIVAAVMMTLPPISRFWNPIFESTYSIMGRLGRHVGGFQHLRADHNPDPLQEVRAVGLVHTVDVAAAVALLLSLFAGARLPDACCSYSSRSFPALPKVLLSCGVRRTDLIVEALTQGR